MLEHLAQESGLQPLQMSVRHQEKGVLVVFEMNESLDNASVYRENRNKQGVLGGVLRQCARTPHPGKRCGGCFQNV